MLVKVHIMFTACKTVSYLVREEAIYVLTGTTELLLLLQAFLNSYTVKWIHDKHKLQCMLSSV